MAIGLAAAPAQAAYPSNGTFMGSVHFSVQCTSGLGVGVAFDGTYLWYTCYRSGLTPDLLRADPTTGLVTASYDIDHGLGAIAYDATRNAIWAAPGAGSTADAIWLIKLDAAHLETSAAVKFIASGDTGSLDDGLGFDATDDTLYFKPDDSNPIHHYKTDGTKLTDINGYPDPCNGMNTSGLAIGGNLLFEGKDGCSHVWVVDKHTLAPAFNFSTQIAGDPNFRDEGLTCDNKTFPMVDVMWSKEAYFPMRASAFAIPLGTCGVGGQPPPPSDKAISATGTNVNAIEGQPFNGPVATFTDPDPAATSAEYTATIDWGDGTPVTPGAVSGPVSGSFTVSGTHTYVEETGTTPYAMKVVITDMDNPGNTATVTPSASVSDASLATPICPTTISPQIFNGATAGFSDTKLGTHLEDFPSSNVTIDWGDGTSTSNGMVGGPNPYTVTGGPHTYSGTGNFTITTTVTDVGGSSITIQCVVLVFAFGTSSGATFVIGDMTAPPLAPPLNQVTWWSSQWAALNPMTGGPAPASMKGFAGFEDMPVIPQCTGTYTTDTGNSSPPPQTVPDYMAVIVSSHITQNGSVITGDIKEIVIVKNDPGYGPSPGHAGTGKVVAILC
jgi:hypothetical protein